MREMKDSGLDWIAQIPKNWSTNKMKYLFSNGKGLSITKENLIETGLPVINYGQIHSKSNFGTDIKPELLRFVDYSYQVLYPQCEIFQHDFVFADTSEDYDGCGNCAYKRDDTVLFGGYHSIIMHSIYNEDNRYYAYLFKTDCWRKQLREVASGVKVFSITQKALMNCSLIVPPKDEQKAISDYLDSKCAEYEAIVSDIHQQIENLEEYKRSVIIETVTKGLDPNVEMKNSGIAWVGYVPKHWVLHPLYCYFAERKNKNALGLETNLLSLSYGKIIRKDINSNGGLLPENFNTYNIVEKDDIIIRPTDLQNDYNSLRTGICREHGIITSAYIAMKAIKPVSSEYFYYLLHSYDAMKVFYNMGSGVRQGLKFSEFSRLMVFEPPIYEQNAIVSYLKAKCDEIDLAIAEKKQQIETIEEYKKSLIYEYVTGKKEVQA